MVCNLAEISVKGQSCCATMPCASGPVPITACGTSTDIPTVSSLKHRLLFPWMSELRKQMKEIGGILQMTTRAVADHKYRIMDMLGTRNNADLVKYAVRNHMVAA